MKDGDGGGGHHEELTIDLEGKKKVRQEQNESER